MLRGIVPQLSKLSSHLLAAGAESPKALLVLDSCNGLLSASSPEAFKKDLLLILGYLNFKRMVLYVDLWVVVRSSVDGLLKPGYSHSSVWDVFSNSFIIPSSAFSLFALSGIRPLK